MTYTIKRCRAYFTRCGYEVRLFNSNGSPHARLLCMSDSDPIRFWGTDGRKVRGEAVRFARDYIAAHRAA